MLHVTMVATIYPDLAIVLHNAIVVALGLLLARFLRRPIALSC